MRKEMKTKINAAALFLIAAFLWPLMTLFAVETKASTEEEKAGEGNFEIEASATGNSIRECYEVILDVTNKGADMTGEVVFALDYERITTHYAQTVALPRGEKKQVKLQIPSRAVEADNGSEREFTVMVRRKNGTLEGTKTFKYADLFADRERDGFKVGILSDHPGRLGWMDYNGGIMAINGRQGSIILRQLEQNFDEADLADLKYLVVDDIDTSALDAGQIDCIVDWVSAGGALIIGTGARWESVAGFGEDRLDIRILTEGDASSPMTGIDYGNTYIKENGSFGEIPIKQMGSGAVTVLPLGLGDDLGSGAGGSGDGSASGEDSDFGDDMYLLENLYELMGIYAQGTGADSLQGKLYNMNRLFNFMEEPVPLQFGLVRFLIILYVLLIGPVIYLILKKIKKRELIWVVIPAISFGFVILIFLSGLRYQVRGLNVSSVTVAEASGNGHTHTYFAAYKSGNKPWKADFAQGFYSAMPLEKDYIYTDDYPCTIRTDQGKMSMTHEPGGSFKQIKMLALGENTATGDLYFEEKPGSGMISGELTNETGHDLKYVMVKQGNFAYIFKDVADQTTVSTEDISHREESQMVVSGYGGMQNLSAEYYYDRKYEEARYMAAIEMADYDIYTDDTHTYCLGVTEDAPDLFDDITTENDLMCLYSIR